MYLMIKCSPLDDQWECDANRTPEAIVEDWIDYCHTHNGQYDVWEIVKQKLIPIHDYDEDIPIQKPRKRR